MKFKKTTKITDIEKPELRTREAIALFNQQLFKEALLKFEEPWKDTWGQEERFLRGLIQVAGAFHHFNENRLESALALYYSSFDLLSNYFPVYQNIKVQELVMNMRVAFAELIEKGTRSGVKLNKEWIPEIQIIK